MKVKKWFLLLLAGIVILAGCTKNSENLIEKTGSSDLVEQSDDKDYIPPKMQGAISISVLEADEILKIASDMFMKKYPDVKITINAFRTIETVKTEGGSTIGVNQSEELSNENYISQLNTKIMSGKAEDIVLTSSIPIRKYTDISAFEDLTFFLNHTPEINADNYYMNIFETMKDSKGKLYELPLSCGLGTMIYFDKALVSEIDLVMENSVTEMSYQNALVYAKQLVDSTSKENTYLAHVRRNSADIIRGVFNDNYNEFIDIENKKVNINTKQFIELLKMIEDLENQGYFDTNKSLDYNMEYHFALDSDSDTQAVYYSLLPDTNRCYSMPLSDANGNIATSSYLRFGINSASKNKELAWEFLKFMLSDEVQTLPSSSNLSVNKKGFEISVDEQLKYYNDGNKTNVDKATFKNLLDGWVMQINTYKPKDPTIEIFLSEEIRRFSDKEQSAEETAKVLQSKIDKYLNE